METLRLINNQTGGKKEKKKSFPTGVLGYGGPRGKTFMRRRDLKKKKKWSELKTIGAQDDIKRDHSEWIVGKRVFHPATRNTTPRKKQRT